MVILCGVIWQCTALQLNRVMEESEFSLGRNSTSRGDPVVGVNDTPVFLLNEYIVELNPANFNILNQILN